MIKDYSAGPAAGRRGSILGSGMYGFRGTSVDDRPQAVLSRGPIYCMHNLWEHGRTSRGVFSRWLDWTDPGLHRSG